LKSKREKGGIREGDVFGGRFGEQVESLMDQGKGGAHRLQVHWGGIFRKACEGGGLTLQVPRTFKKWGRETTTLRGDKDIRTVERGKTKYN